MPFVITNRDNAYITSFPAYTMQTVNIKLREGADASKVGEYLAARSPENGSVEIFSRIDMSQTIDGARQLFKKIGALVAAAILLMGLFNLTCAVMLMMNSRRYEIAVLRSVGMSLRQLRAALLREGVCYAFMLIVPALIAGNLVNLAVFSAFRQEAGYAVFSFPAATVAFVALTGAAALTALPIAIHKLCDKEEIVESLKRPDD
jgi:putative ABC transport system permease protein